MDDGAPYSAIGENELNYLRTRVLSLPLQIEPQPAELRQYSFWQYGSGSHASARRRIIGSVVLFATTDNGNSISIRHLVVSGSSQWIVGRNLTRRCNIEYIGRNAIRLPTIKPTDYIQMYEFYMHSHVNIDRFVDFDSDKNHDIIPEISVASTTFQSLAAKPNLSDWSTV